MSTRSAEKRGWNAPAGGAPTVRLAVVGLLHRAAGTVASLTSSLSAVGNTLCLQEARLSE